MESQSARARFLVRHRKLLFGVYCLVLVLLAVLAAEVVLRAKGIKPWDRPDSDIVVTPGGTFFATHPSLGYTHIPGDFSITLEHAYTFRVTHLPNTLRITRPLSEYPSRTRKEEIWLFGCSMTYGWAVNNEDTYAWKLQERLPQYEVFDFGVNAYGTIHSLIQFREQLKQRRPKVAVLAYAWIHDERNTFLRSWHKFVSSWRRLDPLEQPYARLGPDGALRYGMAPAEFREFPLMRHLALSHFLEMRYDEIEANRAHSREVSKLLIKEMAATAAKAGTRFVLALIWTQEPDMVKFAQENGIPVVTLAVDLSIPGHTNEPYDNHPSGIAHTQYADKLEAFLRDGFLDDSTAAAPQARPAPGGPSLPQPSP